MKINLTWITLNILLNLQIYSKFEKQNPQISINVFALEKSDEPNTLYPLYRINYNDLRSNNVCKHRWSQTILKFTLKVSHIKYIQGLFI